MTATHYELPRDLLRRFPPAIRVRGEDYVARRRIRVDAATPARIQATVRGTSEYRVEIVARPGDLGVACTCAYAADARACKHAWALLRFTGENGSLAPLLSVVAGELPREVRAEVRAEDARQGVPATAQPSQAWRSRDTSHRGPVTADDVSRTALDSPASQGDIAHSQQRWTDARRLVYLVDIDETALAAGIVVDIAAETRGLDGNWSAPELLTGGVPEWLAAPDLQDARIAGMLRASEPVRAGASSRTAGFVIGVRAFPTVLQAICETGRCRLRSSRADVDGRTLHMDDDGAWHLRLRVRRTSGTLHTLTGVLARGADEIPLPDTWTMNAAGFVITPSRAAASHDSGNAGGDARSHATVMAFDHAGAFPLATELRAAPSMLLDGELSELLEQLHGLPRVPELDLPEGALVGEAFDEPVPSVTIGNDLTGWRNRAFAPLTLEFCYGAARAAAGTTARTLFDRASRTLHHRNREAELRARSRLLALGAKGEWNLDRREYDLVIARGRLGQTVLLLVQEGWQVRADGVSYRAPGDMQASVSSGIDWFDLSGTVRYGDVQVPLAALLEARRKGKDVVEIAPGTVGLLPIELLDKLGLLAGAAERIDDVTRFRASQLVLLDALLDALPEADVDEPFARARAKLTSFDRVVASDPPESFQGTLRDYQREGLGWFHFLRQFELGGCLADDMGLGKTVQVLALLEARRVEGHGPSLVVVPRSLVFNWMREAERFAPGLRIVDLSIGARRIELLDRESTDVVVTTYGALRRDVDALQGVEFDYAILDEAQAVKNAGTVTAKACRLIRARHRLALSGTPIENRIEELWSLLEFLNPGMLGTSARFAALARAASAPPPVDDEGVLPPETTPDTGANPDGHALLSRALQPVILRRTKRMVATELPERTEQTLEVTLEPKQRAFYNSLLQHFRGTVLDRIERDGLQKSRMHVLEALLRLRQAACHPALADPKKASLPSAKLDALIPTLAEVAAEGHKSIVFSQFTSFLALVRERLDAEGVKYEYLDGRTRDREARVDRFQNDPECPVFLISLKAGGHGLNLTAAEYVYLLDPWWNPAVEAQAIDRAHRIGQTRQVIATRFVARDTIEEKILQLQGSKRALADAILTSDKGALASIGRAELELLLG
ncbi:MAG TPA: DEAD/DEAH box helicase [Gemmatimonas sp.]|nr:DEAD/DEAH box helicase [Gemmatimonas sp.]